MTTAIILDMNDSKVYLLDIPANITEQDLEEYIDNHHDLSDCQYMVVNALNIVTITNKATTTTKNK